MHCFNGTCASWLLLLSIQATQSVRRAGGGKRRSNASGLAYDKAVFMATHNSAEISELGIWQQLDIGCRFLEFDIWAKEFQKYGDYRLGHDGPDDSRLMKGRPSGHPYGNPNTALLGPWMRHIQRWRQHNLDHAPLVIMFDMKDDVSDDAKKYSDGGISRLQEQMQVYFGSSLYWAKWQRSHGWPEVSDIRGKVIVMLSGKSNARKRYYVDTGHNPAITVSSNGNVIEVHSSSDSKKLYYWTGKKDGSTVTWERHGQYDTGSQASVAIRNDNVVVEVHKSENKDEIYYKIGKLNSDMEMEWGPSHQYDSGINPTIKITSSGEVHEIHRSSKTGKRWTRHGVINVGSKKISWHTSARRNDQQTHPRTYSGGVEIQTPGGNLRYRTSGGWLDVSYKQLFFVERQPDCSGNSENSYPLSQGVFHGVKASCNSLPKKNGAMIRAWSYDSSHARTGKDTGNFPASDRPDGAFRSFVASLSNGIVY